jgi:hypothetical protein
LVLFLVDLYYFGGIDAHYDHAIDKYGCFPEDVGLFLAYGTENQKEQEEDRIENRRTSGR